MKYLYCPRCKELRVKSWYALSNKCQRCYGDATPVKIPPSWMTYLSYALYIMVPALIIAYLATDDRTYLNIALIGLVIMLIVSFADMTRGVAYARTKIKVTGSDLNDFRRKGWI